MEFAEERLRRKASVKRGEITPSLTLPLKGGGLGRGCSTAD